MAYFPIVGRLDCASSSVEHFGFWQMNGYGIMSIYKSDWERFGGENNLTYMIPEIRIYLLYQSPLQRFCCGKQVCFLLPCSAHAHAQQRALGK